MDICFNFFLGNYLGMEWLDHREGICLTFYEIAKPFSKLVVPLSIFTSYEAERERNINVQEKHQLVASCTLPAGTWAWPGIEPAIFWSTGQRSIHWATPARAIFTSFAWEFQFLHVLTNTHLNLNHCGKWTVVSDCGFNLHFFNDEWHWVSFQVLICHLNIFLCEVLFSDLFFSLGLFVFLLLSFESSL